jgi:hypothetical protein
MSHVRSLVFRFLSCLCGPFGRCSLLLCAVLTMCVLGSGVVDVLELTRSTRTRLAVVLKALSLLA